MGDGVNLSYDTEGLRLGAASLQDVATRSAATGAALRAAALEASMFGRTAGAAAFAAVLEAARTAQARGFQEEAGRSAGLAGRGAVAADLGDGLTGQTAAVARVPTP